MKFLNKKASAKIALTLALALPFIVPANAFADTASTEVDSGTLSYSASSFSLTPVTLDVTTEQASTGSTTLNVTDNTGTGNGWTINLANSDFTSSFNDPTATGTSVDVKFDSSQFTVETGGITVNAGQTIDATDGPLGYSGTIGSTGASIFEAHKGFGMGEYSVPLNFSLIIPTTATVTAVEDSADSKFKVGENIGLPAGTYTSTLTYTQSAGI